MAWWTLEDEDVFSFNFGRPPTSSPLPVTNSVPGTSSTPARGNMPGTKRTKWEALQRGSDIMSLAKTIGQFPIAKPYSLLFNATFVGLVAIDPLNRLE
jgi:hypothetical protein